MKIDMSNKELYEVIKKAVNGNMKAKFEIILEFDELITKNSNKLGKYKKFLKISKFQGHTILKIRICV